MGPLAPSPTSTLDGAALSVREINRALRLLPDGAEARVLAPRGRHNLAVGIERAVSITIEGHAGYFIGGLSGGQAGGGEAGGPSITVEGFVGWAVGENLMGGRVRVTGSASQSAGASARGGIVIIEGDASLRAGIALKGATVAVAGDTGAMSGFMAQAGTLLVGGDAGPGLGDSLYEAVIYVAGRIDSLGADAQIEDLSDDDVATVEALVDQTGFDHIVPGDVTRVASARQLYHFRSDNHGAY
jgi:glutamate synthase domain-containing protein 3